MTSDMTKVGHIILPWSDQVMSTRDSAKVQTAEGGLEVVLNIGHHIYSFPCRMGLPDPEDWQVQGQPITRWGLRLLGPGVWTVLPSVVVSGEFHAFVTIVGVPTSSTVIIDPSGKSILSS